jgi:two-component system, NarL family, sensor kinase
MLYRSILELFVNAVKHARARRICVRLERGERTLNVTVEDDGISLRATASSAGYGFSTIRERLGHAGGSMHIESVPEHGTKICLCAPLATDRTMNTRALQ